MINEMATGNASRKRTAVSAPILYNYFAHKPWLLALVLVIATFAAYQPAWHAGFIWDDDYYVTRNSLLTAPDGLKRIWFSAPRTDAYFPMVNTTLRLEHRLWGFNPSGYHIVNILVHSLNALLVWAVLKRLTLPGAWLAAAIWAVHPVNVESVAWITELKNTQSTLFYLLTLLAWMKFTDSGTARPWRFYASAVLLYGPALLSKMTACTLPAAMLLVLWLRNEPIDRRRLCQILPFLGYGIAAGLFAVWYEHYLGSYAEAVRQSYSGLERPLIAAHALWFYAAKLAWPANLTFSYPRWEISLRDPLQYSWLIACIAVALLLWRRRSAIGRGPIAAVIFFVAALSPLLGFIPVYTFRFAFVADHYQYLASLGLVALFAAAASTQADTWQLGRDTRCVLSASLLVVLGALTWKQAGVYWDAETLWRDTIAKNPQSWMAQNNLGIALRDQGRLPEAISHWEQAVRINPDYTDAHYNLGLALARLGRLPEAIGHYEQVVRIKPDDTEAHNSMGGVLVQLGRVPEAIERYEQALRIDPDYAAAHYNLGLALLQQGRLPEAISHWEQAVRINPDYADAQYNLGLALWQTGQLPAAVGHYEQALRINPDSVETHVNLGIALSQMGKRQEGLAQFREALRLRPDSAEVHYNVGRALFQTGNVSEAIEQYEQVLQTNPDSVQAHCDLGFALAKLGRKPEAMQQYEQALMLRPDFAPAKRALTDLQGVQSSSQ
jgi:tetratricopeptide (TPR) repeat protein